MGRGLGWLVLAWLVAGCAKAPSAIALRDPRINDAQRGWLVDAQDEVAIARARVDDAIRAREHVRRHNERLQERARAAKGDLGPWQTLGRAREALADLELRLARVRNEHADARLRLVQAEVAVAADLAVYKLEPLRGEVDRHHARLVDLVSKVEQATTAAEDRADEAWTAWQRHLATKGPANRFWEDVDTLEPEARGPNSTDE